MNALFCFQEKWKKFVEIVGRTPFSLRPRHGWIWIQIQSSFTSTHSLTAGVRKQCPSLSTTRPFPLSQTVRSSPPLFFPPFLISPFFCFRSQMKRNDNKWNIHRWNIKVKIWHNEEKRIKSRCVQIYINDYFVLRK